MPIPTAEIYDKEQQNTQTSTNSSSTSNPRNAPSSGDNDGDSERLIRSDLGASGASNNEGERALSREEADRLYEERMEEEYAKREGGA
ncbi:hypothetical protein N7456_004594 [Penicillium angulare]|uniref:Uncharacterized protein n=1 Tax=Penicillium angulare TaxID=116970 RepID=A0A9W9FWW7_9EURO|nr:hypothetical protein N7456_004594 [Penicillium angulare]